MGDKKMNTWRSFLKDDRARIPFSVIGIFLILGSSFTTVYVTQLEMQKASEISSTLDFNEIENLLRYAEADLATALNIAGMKGLKEIGKKPVIQPENSSFSADEINCNRVKDIILDELNIYLTGNYLYDSFNDGRYAINVVIPEDEDYPIASLDNITFSDLEMNMDRFTIPLIGPEAKKSHKTYWVAEVPVNIEIKKLDGASEGEAVTTRKITVSSVITSRYPLLKSLVDEYNDTINGIKPLWTFTTVLSNVYSLARGYKHYSSGKPLNVVDNKHLSPLVNGGLLFEEGLVFGSVDPLSIVEFAIECGKALKNSGDQPLTNMFNGMDGDEFIVDPSDFSKGIANFDAGDDENTSIDDSPHINISEIAEIPLYNYTSIILHFVDIIGNPVSLELVDVSEDDIKNKVEEYIDLGYGFVNIEKGTLEQNQTTLDRINNIISIVYTAEIRTDVKRDTDPTVTYGNHTGYPIDNGTEPWTFDYYEFKDAIDKPPKGLVVPGCTLYGERCDVHWTCQHHWSGKTVETSGNTTWVNWTHFTAVDSKIEEDVTIRVILNNYSEYESTKNDVNDVFYRNDSLNDENLVDTIQKYKDDVFNPNLDELIKTGDGSSNTENISGDFYDWVETESWNALTEILGLIGDIKQDPSINSTNYPNPIELMTAAKNDLLARYTNNISMYLNKSAYQNGSLFSSVGTKAVYCVRDWYVYKIKDDIENVFSSIESKIDEQIENAIPSDAGFSAQDVKDTLSGEAMDALKNQFAIPFGFDINLTHNDDDGAFQWSETTRLAIDQYPNYLDPFEKASFGSDEDFYALKLRNTCTLGPTGLPILPPSPVTPWIITLNIWFINVRGEYAEFKVIDSSDETLFNPLFGHEPQIYVRMNVPIRDKDMNLIGENTRLTFGFDTIAFGAVPSWGMMVGDIGEYIEENGWN